MPTICRPRAKNTVPAQEPTRVDEKTTRQERPVAEGVQSRKRDVPRADHERDHVVEEGCAERHHHQEDHRDPVHREELVVGVRVQDGPVRPRELQTEQERLDAPDDEKRERGDPVEDPDLLVVDGRQPSDQTLGRPRAPERPLVRRFDGFRDGCHIPL
jgi:hypothetical protein